MVAGVRSKASKRNPEGVERHGLKRCRECGTQFTVRIGTDLEASHIKMHPRLQAIHLMCSSKTGISSNQLHRRMGVTLRTAWFMSHRIREALRDDGSLDSGAGGGTGAVDGTFLGLGQEVEDRAPCRSRHKVLTLVDRSTGQAKSAVVKDPGVFTLIPILRANIAREATVFTDEARWHKDLSRDFEVGCAP